MRAKTRCWLSQREIFTTRGTRQSQIARPSHGLWRISYEVILSLLQKMDVELQKLVESGKLTAKAAEQLEKLKPGTFCLHKSWGFGRVTEWNLLLNQIVIDFASKKAHPMQVQYAAENLMPLAREHFLARKANNLTSIKTLAREEPVAVVRNIVESLGGQAPVAQIGEWVVTDDLTEAEWKRWWESTKKLLKASGAF